MRFPASVSALLSLSLSRSLGLSRLDWKKTINHEKHAYKTHETHGSRQHGTSDGLTAETRQRRR